MCNTFNPRGACIITMAFIDLYFECNILFELLTCIFKIMSCKYECCTIDIALYDFPQSMKHVWWGEVLSRREIKSKLIHPRFTRSWRASQVKI